MHHHTIPDPRFVGRDTLPDHDEVYVVGAGRFSRGLAETVARVNHEYLNLTLNPKYDD
jgi:hypothetical protein